MGKWGFQTVGMWERGESPIPGPVQVAMECLATQKCPMERVNATTGLTLDDHGGSNG